MIALKTISRRKKVIFLFLCLPLGLAGCATNNSAFNDSMIQMGNQMMCQSRGGIYNTMNGSCQMPPAPTQCNTTGTVSGGVYSGQTVCQ